VRLNDRELLGLKSVLTALDPNGTCYVFGSRADDLRRGGDIDVYLEASWLINLRQRLETELRLSDACGCKVDLLVKLPAEPEQVIHRIAREGIRL
jgi:uncharacterized protein